MTKGQKELFKVLSDYNSELGFGFGYDLGSGRALEPRPVWQQATFVAIILAVVLGIPSLVVWRAYVVAETKRTAWHEFLRSNHCTIIGTHKKLVGYRCDGGITHWRTQGDTSIPPTIE